MDFHLVFRTDVLVDDGQTGQICGVASLANDRIGVGEDFVDGHRVHLAAVVVAGLDGVFKIATGDLCREVVGDDLTGTVLLLDPGDVWQGDPDRPTVDGKADIGRVGVACGDGDDRPLPGAVQLLARLAICHFEIFVHTLNFSAALNDVPLHHPLLRKVFKRFESRRAGSP